MYVGKIVRRQNKVLEGTKCAATYWQKEMQRCRGPGAGRTGTGMLTGKLEWRTGRRDLSVLVKKMTDIILRSIYNMYIYGYVAIFELLMAVSVMLNMWRSSSYRKRHSWLTHFGAFSLNQPPTRVLFLFVFVSVAIERSRFSRILFFFSVFALYLWYTAVLCFWLL